MKKKISFKDSILNQDGVKDGEGRKWERERVTVTEKGVEGREREGMMRGRSISVPGKHCPWEMIWCFVDHHSIFIGK